MLKKKEKRFTKWLIWQVKHTAIKKIAGTEQQHSLLRAKVKYDHASSPNGLVTVYVLGFVHTKISPE